jgi:hypothetical protein
MLKSNCCEAPVIIRGGKGMTKHYVCSKCGKLCDTHEWQNYPTKKDTNV